MDVHECARGPRNAEPPTDDRRCGQVCYDARRTDHLVKSRGISGFDGVPAESDAAVFVVYGIAVPLGRRGDAMSSRQGSVNAVPPATSRSRRGKLSLRVSALPN